MGDAYLKIDELRTPKSFVDKQMITVKKRYNIRAWESKKNEWKI